jgi:methionyl-tRNA formyltransferase
MRHAPSPVKRVAHDRGLKTYQPESLRLPESQAQLSSVRADAMVVAAYGLLLPPAVLQAARYGAINIHASLLPRWRGAAPIQRALLAGDTQTGVSIMQMDEGLDTGPVFAQRATAIGAEDDSGNLHDRLAELGAQLLIEVLAAIERGSARSTVQPPHGAVYAAKIDKAETWLRWAESAEAVERAVRAFRPTPGALARFHGKPLKIWRARVTDGAGAPGTIVDAARLQVACGTGALVIEELQPAGGRRMTAADFLRGHRIGNGMRFE